MKRAPAPKTPRHVFCLLFAARLCSGRREDIKKIHPTGYVTDLAGAIQPDTKARLEALCTELSKKPARRWPLSPCIRWKGKASRTMQ